MPETVAEMVRLRESVDHLTAQVVSEKQARRQARTYAVAALGALFMAFLIGGLFLLGQVHRVDDTTAQIEATRALNRETACNSYNSDTVDKINGILLTLVARSSDPEAAKERVRPLLLEHRRCDPAGIADYFDDDPATDPFVPVTIP